MNEKKKSCFVITPIGKRGSKIREHIERVINMAIIPALGDKYTITPAHRIDKPGSITKQVIDEICDSELVIANLTGLNPNVMYELAFRHTIGKPVILIAKEGTKIPFDITDERTVYYDTDWDGNDYLIEKLKNFEGEIDFSDNERSGVIYDRLKSKGIEINFSRDQKPTAAELTEFTELMNKLKNEISHAQDCVKSSNLVRANDSIRGSEGILDLTKQMKRIDVTYLDKRQIIEAINELQGLEATVDALEQKSPKNQSALQAAAHYKKWIATSMDNLEYNINRITQDRHKKAQTPPTTKV